MFNKKKCKSCKYSRFMTATGIHCDYSADGRTCLRRNGLGIEDLRGDDPEKCKLFERKK